MGDPAEGTPLLVAAPRHLRRRAFHEEIPDILLVPGVEPIAHIIADSHPTKNRVAKVLDSRDNYVRRKRLVALIVVIAVTLSIPALVITLLLVG